MPCTRRLRFLIGGAASLLRRRPNFGEFPFYELGWIRASRRPEPLRTPAQVSRIGYFRLATLLGLGPLVPDIHLDSPGARPPHFLGGGLLAVLSPAPASPGGFVQLVADVVLRPTGLLNAARCLGALLGRGGCVGAALLDGGGRTLEAVVGVDLVLELWSDLPVVI